MLTITFISLVAVLGVSFCAGYFTLHDIRTTAQSLRSWWRRKGKR